MLLNRGDDGALVGMALGRDLEVCLSGRFGRGAPVEEQAVHQREIPPPGRNHADQGPQEETGNEAPPHARIVATNQPGGYRY